MCHLCWSTPCTCTPTVPQWESPALAVLEDRVAYLRLMEAVIVSEAERYCMEAAQ